MHGYCDCKNCRNEWTARNAYHIEDDFDTKHKRRGKAKTKKHFKGCPANNRKAHIYVWIEYHGKRRDWYSSAYKLIDAVWWDKVCVGCGHKANRRYPWGSKPYDVYEVRHVDYYFW